MCYTHAVSTTLSTYLPPSPHSYFTVLGEGEDLRGPELESTRGEYVLAHNGWVMNADPLVNFANEGSQVS